MTLVKESARVAFSFPTAPKPPPPPPPPPPPCNDPGTADCVCPHIAVGVPAPACTLPPPAPCVAAAGCDPATFLGVDTKTQGDFQGVYGASGFTFFGLGKTPSQLPAFVQSVNISGAAVRTWVTHY